MRARPAANVTRRCSSRRRLGAASDGNPQAQSGATR
jgi:hypothetical protein